AAALVDLIADPNPVVAGQAIRWAGEAQAAASVPRLVERLRDKNLTLRFRAATALGRIGDPSSVNVLLDSLAGEAQWPRYASFTALNRVGRAHSKAWAAIVSRLSDSNSRIAEGAQFALRATYDLGLIRAL